MPFQPSALNSRMIYDYLQNKYNPVPFDYGKLESEQAGVIDPSDMTRKTNISGEMQVLPAKPVTFSDTPSAPSQLERELTKPVTPTVTQTTPQPLPQQKQPMAESVGQPKKSTGNNILDAIMYGVGVGGETMAGQPGRTEKQFQQGEERRGAEAIYAKLTDPKSQESIVYQRIAKEFMPGYDWSNFSVAQIKETLPQMSKVFDDKMQKEIAGDRASLGERNLSLREQKYDTMMRERNIPGLEILPDAIPSKEASRAAQNDYSSARATMNLMGQLKGLINKHGVSKVVPDASRGEMMSILAQLRGLLRVPIGGPGVMTEQDYQRVKEALPNISMNPLREVLNEQELGKLAQWEDYFETTFNEKLYPLGYKVKDLKNKMQMGTPPQVTVKQAAPVPQSAPVSQSAQKTGRVDLSQFRVK